MKVQELIELLLERESDSDIKVRVDCDENGTNDRNVIDCDGDSITTILTID